MCFETSAFIVKTNELLSLLSLLSFCKVNLSHRVSVLVKDNGPWFCYVSVLYLCVLALFLQMLQRCTVLYNKGEHCTAW